MAAEKLRKKTSVCRIATRAPLQISVDEYPPIHLGVKGRKAGVPHFLRKVCKDLRFRNQSRVNQRLVVRVWGRCPLGWRLRQGRVWPRPAGASVSRTLEGAEKSAAVDCPR